MKSSDRYPGLIEWSPADQCYTGSAPGLIGPCCHGKYKSNINKQLCLIIKEWVEIYEKDNLPLPESLLH